MHIETDPYGIAIRWPSGLTLLVDGNVAIWTLDGLPLRWLALIPC